MSNVVFLEGTNERYKKIKTKDEHTFYKTEDNLYLGDVELGLKVDDTFELLGSAADAKIVGDRFKEVEDKLSSVETFVEFAYTLHRTGKVYQAREYLFESNTTSICEKLKDNANLVFEPSTDTVEGRDDYEQIPLFKWVYVNYVRDEDGSPRPIAIEGMNNYKTDGSVDVGAMQMSFYWNVKDDVYDGKKCRLWTISDMPHPELGLVPWCECVRSDKSVMPWCIGSAYYSGKASDGMLRSQPNLMPKLFQSHNSFMSDYPKKGDGYHGAGTERNLFQIIFNMIKGGQKSSQKLYAGCTNYNFQYEPSVKRSEKLTYFTVTENQANNIEIGSTVSVGYGYLSNGAVEKDRGNANVRKYADMVVVTKKEKINDGNVNIFLDTKTGFSTEDVDLGNSITSPVFISSMPWISGTTNKVLGHHDGSYKSNSNGRFPYRVQGREYANGSYVIASNVVMLFQSDYSKDIYVTDRNGKRYSNENDIKLNYKKIGNIPCIGDGLDFWVGDIAVNIDTGSYFPNTNGTSDQLGTGDRCYGGGKATGGLREFLMCGALWFGSRAGSCYVGCGGGLSTADWYCGGCD